MENNIEDVCKDIENKIDIVDIVNYLNLKKGKGESSYYCPLHEDSKPSFIAKRGNKFYKCAANCGTGNLYQLVQKVKGISYIEAVKEASVLAGVNFDIVAFDKVKQIEETLIPLKQTHIDYIINHRLWTKEQIEKFKLQSWKDYIVLPNIKNNQVINYKYINFKSKLAKLQGKKIESKYEYFFRGNDVTCNFFPNNNFIDTEVLVIVEGEFDVGVAENLFNQATDGLNYKVISSTSGASSYPPDILTQICKRKCPKLQKIIIIYDNDEAGRKGGLKLADILSVLENIEIVLYYFPDDKKKGYDITDFVKDGYSYYDLVHLKKNIYDPRQKENVKVNESDSETEKQVLQYLIQNNKAINDLQAENIRVSDFKDWRLQEIYKKILSLLLSDDGIRYVDFDLLESRLYDNQVLSQALNEIIYVRSIRTIEELFTCINAMQLSSYKALLRQEINKLTLVEQTNFRNIESIKEVLTGNYATLLDNFDIGDTTKSTDVIFDDLKDGYHTKSEKDIFLTTPYAELNESLGGGFRVGNVHFVTGEVSLGKSIFAREQTDWSSSLRVPSICYVTETDYEEIAENLLASRTTTYNNLIRRRNLPRDKSIEILVSQAKRETDKDNCFYKEAFDMTFSEIVSNIKYQIRRRGIKLVVIDQLTSIPTEGGKKRHEFITDCMKTLVRLAKKEKICIIILGQLKAEAQGKKASKGSFNKSDASASDVAESATLHRESYTVIILQKVVKDDKEIIKALLDKNRNHIKGISCEITPQKEYSRFKRTAC